MPSFLTTEQSTTEWEGARAAEEIGMSFSVYLQLSALPATAWGRCWCVRSSMAFSGVSAFCTVWVRCPIVCYGARTLPLLLFLSFTVCCAVLFVFWCTVPLWNELWNWWTKEANSIRDPRRWQRYNHALRWQQSARAQFPGAWCPRNFARYRGFQPIKWEQGQRTPNCVRVMAGSGGYIKTVKLRRCHS